MFRLAERVACATLAGAFVVAAAGRAAADDSPTSPASDARIEYHAPTSCPTVDDLVTAITARLPRFHASDGSPRRFIVDVAAREDRFVGRLTALDATGARAERDVAGDSCDEVVGALGLVLAIAIEPGVALATTTELTSRDVAVERATVPHVAETPPAPRASRTALRSTAPDADEHPPSDAHREGRDAWAAGAGLASTVGEVDVRLLGATAFIERAIDIGTWRPVVRLGATRASSDTVDVPGHGSAHFTWTVGMVDVCPLRWGEGRWSLTPCARIDSGAIAGRGSNIAHPRDDARFWLDAGAVARGEWQVLSPLFLRLEGGVLVPLTRPRFHFDTPDITVASPAPVGAIAALYMGGHFP